MKHTPATLKQSDLVGIGLSQSYASELLNGVKTPSFKVALEIERAFGIAPAEWLFVGNLPSYRDRNRKSAA